MTGVDPARTTQPEAALKGNNGPNAAPKSLLSFSEEMEDAETANNGFSLARKKTRRKPRKRDVRPQEPNRSGPPSSPACIKDVTLGSSHLQGSAHTKSLGHMCFGVASSRGARSYMEDRQTVVASYSPAADGISRSFAGVYDGHNGDEAAELCCNRLHAILASNPTWGSCTGSAAVQQAEKQTVSAALRGAFRSLDKEILRMLKEEETQDGSTGLVLLRIGEVLYTAHCGDSRAVLCRAGRAVRMTEDHKPNLPAEAERIRQVGGRIEFSKCWRVVLEPLGLRPGSGLAVSRSFGDLDFKEPCRLVECEPDVNHWQLQEADSFAVLASDGLWDVMSDQEAVHTVQKVLTSSLPRPSGRRFTDQDARSAADVLVSDALKKGTMDNVTAIVCLLPWN
ncbi:hypothetical protein ABBQ38_001995 [Trebouxia sp. C0009 RCD-2024]